MSKALEQELFQYILQLDEAEKKSVLPMLKTFVKGREEKASRISIEEYNQVVWTKRSQKQMRQVFKHISKDSPKNASKVLQETAEAVQKAIPNPEIYGPDKYKTDNDLHSLALS